MASHQWGLGSSQSVQRVASFAEFHRESDHDSFYTQESGLFNFFRSLCMDPPAFSIGHHSKSANPSSVANGADYNSDTAGNNNAAHQPGHQSQPLGDIRLDCFNTSAQWYVASFQLDLCDLRVKALFEVILTGSCR
jgi:hypothetical protein